MAHVHGSLSRRSRRRRARRAGFSLIELMVALTLGMIVIASVYTIGGASSWHFQEQQRIGQLQLATRMALERVRRDVQRAGFQGTPDSNLERTCGLAPPQRLRAVDSDCEPSSSTTWTAAAGPRRWPRSRGSATTPGPRPIACG
jgi:prepilin-type N-terminal cleavage/methylation domain-containing protein